MPPSLGSVAISLPSSLLTIDLGLDHLQDSIILKNKARAAHFTIVTGTFAR
jgi:hypothetical protein